MRQLEPWHLVAWKPAEFIVLLGGAIGDVAVPCSDEPDDNVEPAVVTVGVDYMRNRITQLDVDDDAQLLVEPRASASWGDSPSRTWPPGRSHTSGYHRRSRERWPSSARPSRTSSAATTVCTKSVNQPECARLHPPGMIAVGPATADRSSGVLGDAAVVRILTWTENLP